MDLSATTMFRLILPQTPLLLKTILYHALSWSPTSSKCDLKTVITVTILRALMDAPAPIGKSQHITRKDPGVKGPMWISKSTFTVDSDSDGGSSDDVTGALNRGIQASQGFKGGGGLDYYYNRSPELLSVEVEWTGSRDGVDANTPEPPSMSESEKYTALMEEVRSPVTVLYFHGGGYLVCDPCTHRGVTSELARLTSGRVCSVRYRLAPQAPFPNALLDALVAYLSLLSPRPGSFHEAVDPRHVVFAGDSAGGNLALVLLELILELRRLDPDVHINFNGKRVPLSLPAGCAGNSPWCDVSMSMPSVTRNVPYDFLPPLPVVRDREQPADNLWPTKPPRVHMFSPSAAMISHPLVSPMMAPASKWINSPPVFMCVGQELLQDEILVTARRIHDAGSTVVLESFEGMPHCFALLIPDHPATKKCMKDWADFMVQVVVVEHHHHHHHHHPAAASAASLKSKAVSVDPLLRECSETEIGFENLTSLLTDDQVSRLVEEAVAIMVLKERRKELVGEEGTTTTTTTNHQLLLLQGNDLEEEAGAETGGRDILRRRRAAML